MALVRHLVNKKVIKVISERSERSSEQAQSFREQPEMLQNVKNDIEEEKKNQYRDTTPKRRESKSVHFIVESQPMSKQEQSGATDQVEKNSDDEDELPIPDERPSDEEEHKLIFVKKPHKSHDFRIYTDSN